MGNEIVQKKPHTDFEDDNDDENKNGIVRSLNWAEVQGGWIERIFYGRISFRIESSQKENDTSNWMEKAWRYEFGIDSNFPEFPPNLQEFWLKICLGTIELVQHALNK